MNFREITRAPWRRAVEGDETDATIDSEGLSGTYDRRPPFTTGLRHAIESVPESARGHCTEELSFESFATVPSGRAAPHSRSEQRGVGGNLPPTPFLLG